MFSRSYRSKSGFAKEKRSRGRDVQEATLTELGLLGLDYPTQPGGAGAWRTDFDRPNYTNNYSSSSAARSYAGTPYSEKGRSSLLLFSVFILSIYIFFAC